MAQFLSPAWVSAFDVALEQVTLPDLGDDAGLAALDGEFTVAQQVRSGPEGDIVTVLTASAGHLHLILVPAGDDFHADVTISLSYEDAARLSTGSLNAAQALTEGRVHVRGDLSVLAAGQAMLAAAQPHLSDLSAATSY